MKRAMVRAEAARFKIPKIPVGDEWKAWFILWDGKFTLRLEERSNRTRRSDGTPWISFVEMFCAADNLPSPQYRLESLCDFVGPKSTLIFIGPSDKHNHHTPSSILDCISDEQVGMIVSTCIGKGIDYIFWSPE